MRNIHCNVGFLVFAITASISSTLLNNNADFRPYYQKSTDIAEFLSSPIVIPPSQYFEGADGHWSTFNIRIGTPATSIRVVVSTNSPATLIVLPGGCTTNAMNPVPLECSNSRGGTFNNTLSRTWIDQGIFGINGVSNGFEANLGYNFDADYGLDTLGLGYSDGANGPTLKNQTVAAYAMASPLYIACLLFEKAFGLVWNETTSMYLMNSTQYALLSGANPTVTFSLANTISGGSIVNIQLPIGAFALRASYPFVDNTTYYFPLKRAANDTQYTLGRTFLQEAYLTVDYDRGNFSINQCTWIDGAASSVVAIRAPSIGTSNPSNDTSSSLDKVSPKLLSPGAIAGIAIGALALIFIPLTLLILHCRNHHTLFRDPQFIGDNLALTNIQSNYPAETEKKSIVPSEDISLVASSERGYFRYQDPKLKHAPYISSNNSLNESIRTSNSELDNTERKIYQLSGESKRPELENTDMGYRFELAEERSLPIELSGESMRVEELMSPTLGEEERFVQLRELGNSRIERPGKSVEIVRAREGVTSWDNDWPETPETGVVMGYGPCERNKCGDTIAGSGSLNTTLRGSDIRSMNDGPGSSDRGPDDFSDAAKSYKTGFL
ncbi:hypothetical protein EYC84_004307 [Monilinia fructicola]|uniref:Peptidase A1 domain-containing protein n=1 Tax=Monilinia fructicola TaxID=38448 RepID=A0A5M9JZW7_MONFR|nr:hypothetical protein EYC84_004307 [Monilinia fructicola]